jgi:SpoIID/LytB domain protein
MAQDGAFWMGKGGSTTAQMLAHFYPGTKLGKAGGDVRVAVLTAGPDNTAVLSFPAGGEVRDGRDGNGQSPGFPVAVPPGGQVRVRWDGSRYSVDGGRAAAAQLPTSSTTTSTTTTTTTSPPSDTSSTTATTSSSTTTTSAPPPSSPPPQSGAPASARALWAVPSGPNGTVAVPARGRRYRGAVEATAAAGPLRLVDQVDVEQYLRGMGEVRDPHWPPASLRAQATAARTYAMRAMAASRELCDDQRCQVYLGADAEYAAMDKAVADTRGQVLQFNGRLAAAVYSANGGGFSASREEGFGTAADDGAYPYLRAAAYTTEDTRPWSVQVAVSDVAARLGYPAGQLASATVARTGPSGRVLEVRLDGAAGPKAVGGIAFARAFSLHSTLFTLSGATAEAAPAPPPGEAGEQALPDVAGTPLDPNALPPVPLAEELAAAGPGSTLPPASGEVAPPFRYAPVPRRHHDWPWISAAAFLVVSAAAATGAYVVLARART